MMSCFEDTGGKMTNRAVETKGKLHEKVAVVGGGLAGSLMAIYLARRGFQVDVYEANKDTRKQEFITGQISVNLALSDRGIVSLKEAGVEGPVLSIGIPMHTRMIHSHSGKTHLIPYGKTGQYVLSVERRKLHEHLLSVAETFPAVSLHFEHKLIAADLEKGQLKLQCKDGKTFDVKADVVIGCDGMHSAIRRELMRKPGFDFSQEYIPHYYKELHLPPTADGEFALPLNYLHVWPRQANFLIALPNPDKSYTCTMYLPCDQFDSLKTKDDVLDFFQEEFPGFVSVMGRENLVKEFFRNPTGSMMSMKCKPYHVLDKALIIGDAAHAMVPFNGQGANCAFEDCLVLDGLLEKHDNEIGEVLKEYSKVRNKDAEAICDLAMYNYVRMKVIVTSPLFLAKNKVFNLLHWLMPKTFIPMYSMLTFSQMPYHKVIERSDWQDKIVKRMLVTSFLLAGLGGVLATLGTPRPDVKQFLNIAPNVKLFWA